MDTEGAGLQKGFAGALCAHNSLCLQAMPGPLWPWAFIVYVMARGPELCPYHGGLAVMVTRGRSGD